MIDNEEQLEKNDPNTRNILKQNPNEKSDLLFID